MKEELCMRPENKQNKLLEAFVLATIKDDGVPGGSQLSFAPCPGVGSISH